MCGIMITTKRYDGSMSHRGTRMRRLVDGKLTFIHEHLPIQAPSGYNSIIETTKFIILFNGELFLDEYDNDLQYIHDVFSLCNTVEEAIKQIIDVDGFYAFIVHDTETGNVYAFTDPLGKKQLYYDENSIASELRPLHKGAVNYHHLARTIKFGYVMDDTTPYLTALRVLPNRLYIFDRNLVLKKIQNKRLYDFKRGRSESLYELMHEAVENRLKGHESVGLLLSGGLDSSIIYHHILNSRKEVNTYCVNNLEDLQHARLMDPNVKSIDLSYNEKALAAMEMPLDLGSMYPQYDLFSKVNETVILTGDGADEVFGGYRRMKQYDSQLSDIFDELPFYHNIRIDRMSMIHTKEARSPFMSLKVVEYGLGLWYEQRVNKQHLRDTYEGILPDEIINRAKEPLKTDIIREKDGVEYRSELVIKWLKENK